VKSETYKAFRIEIKNVRIEKPSSLFPLLGGDGEERVRWFSFPTKGILDLKKRRLKRN